MSSFMGEDHEQNATGARRSRQGVERKVEKPTDMEGITASTEAAITTIPLLLDAR